MDEHKIVINTRYGGFSVSEAAVRRGREISGDPCWMGFLLKGEMDTDGVEADYNYLHLRDGQVPELQRLDATLIAVVEELGDAANGGNARLIVHIFKGNKFRIGEYDGSEWIETPDTIYWITVP
jgi:hypothetical protein